MGAQQNLPLVERRWCFSPDVQVREEAFGAIAYHRRLQRLLMLDSPVVLQLRGLLKGVDPAVLELAPLGLDASYCEALLAQLAEHELVVSADRSDDVIAVCDRRFGHSVRARVSGIC